MNMLAEPAIVEEIKNMTVPDEVHSLCTWYEADRNLYSFWGDSAKNLYGLAVFRGSKDAEELKGRFTDLEDPVLKTLSVDEAKEISSGKDHDWVILIEPPGVVADYFSSKE